MVESLEELRKICQKPRYKEVGNWYVRHILRDAALPITRLLLHTNITANQVTFFSIIVGALGVAYYAVPTAGAFFIASLLLQAWYLLDHVDGQIARYYKTASLTGRFYDFVMHHLIHGILPFGLGAYAAARTGHNFYFVWGFAASASVFMFNLIHDTKYKTFFEKMDQIPAIKFKERKRSAGDEELDTVESPSGFRKLYSLLHKSIEIHVMINILTVMAFIGLWIDMGSLRVLLFFYYGFLAPFLAISKIAYLLHHKTLDQEFHERFDIE